jgi:hypothetical protein
VTDLASRMSRQMPAGALFTPQPWTEQAACATAPDPDLWFVSVSVAADKVRQAKTICRTCPVAAPCLVYAVQFPIPLYGVWAGTTEADRERIRRRNKVTR